MVPAHATSSLTMLIHGGFNVTNVPTSERTKRSHVMKGLSTINMKK